MIELIKSLITNPIKEYENLVSQRERLQLRLSQFRRAKDLADYMRINSIPHRCGVVALEACCLRPTFCFDFPDQLKETNTVIQFDLYKQAGLLPWATTNLERVRSSSEVKNYVESIESWPGMQQLLEVSEIVGFLSTFRNGPLDDHGFSFIPGQYLPLEKEKDMVWMIDSIFPGIIIEGDYQFISDYFQWAYSEKGFSSVTVSALLQSEDGLFGQDIQDRLKDIDPNVWKFFLPYLIARNSINC